MHQTRVAEWVSKVKMSHHHHAGAKGERYSSYSFLTSAPDGVSGQRQAVAVLYPQERTPQYPLNGRLGQPRILDGTRRNATKAKI
jgi:hypothetical protein